MTKEKDQKKTGKLKASIGAWWKSITQEPDPEEVKEENKKKQQVEKPAQEKEAVEPVKEVKGSGRKDYRESVGQEGKKKREDALRQADDAPVLKQRVEQEGEGLLKTRPTEKSKSGTSRGRYRGKSKSGRGGAGGRADKQSTSQAEKKSAG